MWVTINYGYGLQITTQRYTTITAQEVAMLVYIQTHTMSRTQSFPITTLREVTTTELCYISIENPFLSVTTIV